MVDLAPATGELMLAHLFPAALLNKSSILAVGVHSADDIFSEVSGLKADKDIREETTTTRRSITAPGPLSSQALAAFAGGLTLRSLCEVNSNKWSSIVMMKSDKMAGSSARILQDCEK